MSNPGNFFAIIALFAWFPITFLFFTRNKPAAAAALSIIGGFLFLPELVSVNLPIFPDLSKRSIPVIATFVCCLIKAPGKLSQAKPFRGVDLFIVLLFVQQIGTWLTNGDFVPGGPLPRPGLTFYDFLGDVVTDGVLIYGLFFLGRALYTTAEEVTALLRIAFKLSMIYAVGCLIELKFSPQMHNWIYGFMQHDFAQMIRGGGYRPMLFTTHGLVLARYMAASVAGGCLLWRLNMVKGKMVAGLVATIVVFVACKSTGAIGLFLLFAPYCLFGAPKSQARIAFIIAFIVAAYPALRGTDTIPVDDLLDLAGNISEERANSLAYRLENETQLLDHVREKHIWFGWGGYSRHAIYSSDNKNLTIVDGEWIAVFSTRGIVGFIGYYGLFVLPIFIAWRRMRSVSLEEYGLLLGGLMVVAALLIFDTLPNSSGSLPAFFYTGALAGAAPGLVREDARRRQRIREERIKRLSEPPPAPDTAPAEPFGVAPNAF